MFTFIFKTLGVLMRSLKNKSLLGLGAFTGRPRRLLRSGLCWLFCFGFTLTLLLPAAVTAQSVPELPVSMGADQKALPTDANTYEYRLSFNRDARVGNRIRLEGIYQGTNIFFSRPRSWNLTAAKVRLRLQHSPSLIAERSNLVARINDTSIGSVPLDQPGSEVMQATFDIPLNLIQDRNLLILEVEQNTSETCTNPSSPALWTEILSDSEFVFRFTPKAEALDFNRYPYPFFDDLGFDTTRLTYVEPAKIDDTWLTALTRYQASIGRLVDYHRLESRLIGSVAEATEQEGIVMVGTPANQPGLGDLELPLALQSKTFFDASGKAYEPGVGLLMLTSAAETGAPILVVTGNDEAGVAKAVQYLTQSTSESLGTGQVVTVEDVPELSSPDPQDWPGYLPMADKFTLRELVADENLAEQTVRGSSAPPVTIDFHALPDDRFSRGSNMVLHYSHSSQINPRTSSVTVSLDDIVIDSKPLSRRRSEDQTFYVNLPPSLIKADSQIKVQFYLIPESDEGCGVQADKQLWGTVHGDTSFDLSRDTVVTLPDLELMRYGYPFTAPQDLSQTAVAMPNQPSQAELEVLLALGGRLGRLSQAQDVKLNVYQMDSMPQELRSERHWIGIGRRDRFPLEAGLKTPGVGLVSQLTRQWQGRRIAGIKDEEGMIKAVISPWNQQRMLLALVAQTDKGLQQVEDTLSLDPLFYTLQGDTTIVASKVENPSPYSVRDYVVRFLEEAPTTQIVKAGLIRRGSLFIEDHWYVLPLSMVVLAMILYSVSQRYLNRVDDSQNA